MEFCCSQQPSSGVTYGRHWLVEPRAQIWKGTYQEHSLKQKLAVVCFTSPLTKSLSLQFLPPTLSHHCFYSPLKVHHKYAQSIFFPSALFLCCVTVAGMTQKKVFQRSPFLCGLHPVFFFNHTNSIIFKEVLKFNLKQYNRDPRPLFEPLITSNAPTFQNPLIMHLYWKSNRVIRWVWVIERMRSMLLIDFILNYFQGWTLYARGANTLKYNFYIFLCSLSQTLLTWSFCPYTQTRFRTKLALHSTEKKPFPIIKSAMKESPETVGTEEGLSSNEAGTLSNGNSDTIIPECTSPCLIIGH